MTQPNQPTLFEYLISYNINNSLLLIGIYATQYVSSLT